MAHPEIIPQFFIVQEEKYIMNVLFVVCKYLSRKVSDYEHPNSFFNADVTGCNHRVTSYKHRNYIFSLNRQCIQSRAPRAPYLKERRLNQ